MPVVIVWIDIDAPLRQVWEGVSNLADHATWMTDVESITFEGTRRAGAGTEMRVATKIGPFRTMDRMTVTSWHPERLIGVEHTGLVSGEGEFRLDPVGGATRITWSERLHFPWRFGGPIGAVIAQPLLHWMWQRSLRALKAQMEKNPQT